MPPESDGIRDPLKIIRTRLTVSQVRRDSKAKGQPPIRDCPLEIETRFVLYVSETSLSSKIRSEFGGTEPCPAAP